VGCGKFEATKISNIIIRRAIIPITMSFFIFNHEVLKRMTLKGIISYRLIGILVFKYPDGKKSR